FDATAQRLIAALGAAVPALRDDPSMRAAVTEQWMAARAYSLATAEMASRVVAGEQLGAEASLSKVFWSDLDVAMHETALRLRGADADIDDGWMREYEFVLAGPIYAGTNEIQLNIIAERLLGMPRG